VNDMTMFLAATGPREQLFYIIAPDNPRLDGVVMWDNQVMYVPFWSYVSRSSLQPVRGAALLDELWSEGKDQSEDWAAKFFSREIPFTEEEVLSVEFLVSPVPEERTAAKKMPGYEDEWRTR